MLNPEYVHKFKEYVYIALYQEQNEDCLYLLNQITDTDFISHYFHSNLILLFERCLNLSTDAHCIEIYQRLINGIRIEGSTTLTLN